MGLWRRKRKVGHMLAIAGSAEVTLGPGTGAVRLASVDR